MKNQHGLSKCQPEQRQAAQAAVRGRAILLPDLEAQELRRARHHPEQGRFAGEPLRAHTNLLISYKQCDRIINDARIKGVALTGSLAAGRLVAARAEQNMQKSVMELGGSDAFIKPQDADLDKTLPWGRVGPHVPRRLDLLCGKALYRDEGGCGRVFGETQDRTRGTAVRRPND